MVDPFILLRRIVILLYLGVLILAGLFIGVITNWFSQTVIRQGIYVILLFSMIVIFYTIPFLILLIYEPRINRWILRNKQRMYYGSILVLTLIVGVVSYVIFGSSEIAKTLVLGIILFALLQKAINIIWNVLKSKSKTLQEIDSLNKSDNDNKKETKSST